MPGEEADDLARRTIARVIEALENSPSAHVAQVVQIIREISGRADEITVQFLAEAIGRDPATMARVIRVANTLGYNPKGADITTITHAVQLIGFERVRNLSVSLMLMGDAEGRANSEETRDAAATGITCGLIAEELMRQGTGRDPELAFVSAVLRNFGRMTMTSFMAADYREARALMVQLGDDRAYIKIFGLTPIELARALFTAMQMPEPILKSIQALPEGLVDRVTLSLNEELLVFSDFSLHLCELIDSEVAATPGFIPQAEALVERYGRHVHLNDDGMKGLLATVSEKLTTFGQTHGITSFTSPLIQRVCALSANRPLPPAQKARSWTRRGEAPESRNRQNGEKSSQRRGLRDGAEEVGRLAQQPSPPLVEIFAIAIQRLVAVTAAKEGLLFVREANGSTFAVAASAGALFGRVENLPVVNANSRDIFGVSILRGEDVIIENPTEAKIAPFVPAWLAQATGVNPIQLLPIKDPWGTFAVICIVGEGQQTLTLAGQAAPEILALRAQLAGLGAKVRSAGK